MIVTKINTNVLLYWEHIWDLLYAWNAPAIFNMWSAYRHNLNVSTAETEKPFSNAKLSRTWLLSMLVIAVVQVRRGRKVKLRKYWVEKFLFW